MAITKNQLRFRIESALVYFAVAAGAVAYVMWRLELPRLDSWMLIGFIALPLFAALFGGLFASWYMAADSGWFEIVSVPLLVLLLAAIAGSLSSQLWTSIEAASSRAISVSEWAGAATVPAFAFLYIALPLVAVIGLAVSLLLRMRARRLPFAA